MKGLSNKDAAAIVHAVDVLKKELDGCTAVAPRNAIINLSRIAKRLKRKSDEHRGRVDKTS